jgi:translation initiation factor IF-1
VVSCTAGTADRCFTCYFVNILADEKLKQDGIVIEALPDTKFKVKLQDEREVLAYLSGKMRMHYIKVIIGDRVTLELSPDGTKGRIIYRR